MSALIDQALARADLARAIAKRLMLFPLTPPSIGRDTFYKCLEDAFTSEIVTALNDAAITENPDG